MALNDDARTTQIQERAFWMSRDLEQAGVVRDNCQKQGELLSLIDQNNGGARE